MNMNFRRYVTDVAFKLTLGKTHITAMAAIVEGRWSRAQDFGLWVPAINQLIHRGLVDALPVWNTPDGSYHPDASLNQETLDAPFHQRYKLTEEGKLVWKLIVLAGLIEEPIKPFRSPKKEREVRERV